MTTKTVVLHVEPALPCGVLVDGVRCGQPTRVAQAEFISERDPGPGEWVILPVCEDCAHLAAAVYADWHPASSDPGGQNELQNPS